MVLYLLYGRSGQKINCRKMKWLLNKRILLSIALFIYQSCLDLKRMSITESYTLFQNEYISFMKWFTLGNRPGLFVTLYIIHRAFIHGLIVRYFSGQKKMLLNYMILDLIIFVISFLVIVGRRLFDPYLDFTEPLVLFLLKLLDTPLLLLFFLPAYYLFRELENQGSGFRV